MTVGHTVETGEAIIPYQELLGNYDFRHALHSASSIIPYQELLGNYDLTHKL